MNTFSEKVASGLYRLASGESANALRSHYEDLAGAVTALNAHTDVTMEPWAEVFSETRDSEELAVLFNKYGTDSSANITITSFMLQSLIAMLR